MKGKNLTHEEKQLVTLLYLRDKKPSEIASIVGIGKTSVFRILHEAGIETSKSTATKQTEETEKTTDKKADNSPVLTEITENTRRMVELLEKLAVAWGANE